MPQKIVNQFLGCYTLEGATTIAVALIISLLENICALILSFTFGNNPRSDLDFLFITIYVFIALTIVTTVSMYIGSKIEKRYLMVPYLLFSIIEIPIMTTITWCGIFKYIASSKDVDIGQLCAFFGGFAQAGFSIYYRLVVLSRFSEIAIQEENQRLL